MLFDMEKKKKMSPSVESLRSFALRIVEPSKIVQHVTRRAKPIVE